MSSHSRCRIGANACARSRRASHKSSVNRWSIRVHRLARSRLNPEISVAPFPERSPLLARPRSRDRAQRAHGVRRPLTRARPIRRPARCAASRSSNADADTATRVCRKARREHGLRAMEATRKALAAQSAAGNDPRGSAAVNRTRGEAVSERHRRNRSWAREHPGQRDEAWFRREIAPKLDAFSLKAIAAATGLSLAACSRIRAGAKVPRQGHWENLRELVDS
jgi:hypothetical protein